MATLDLLNLLPVKTAPGTRVTDGLLSLYTFDEGDGSTVFDVSGVGDPLNLSINNLAGVTWGTGVLDIQVATLIASNQAATKIINGITQSQEITLEAWITPDNLVQSGPARIATLSQDTGNRNFTLGQQGNAYEVRLRTTTTGDNGTGPVVSSLGEVVTQDLAHVVYSREADGDAFLYVNNQLVTSGIIAGDLSNWAGDYQFALGNELSGDRPWLGSYDLLAIYNQAFDASEVDQNFRAGSSPSAPPVADNEPPTITLPFSTASILVDTPLVFSGASSISVSDPDDDLLTLSVKAPSGSSLALSQTAGVDISADLDGDESFIAVGSVAALNAALNGLSFTPSSGFTGKAQITGQS